MAEGPKVVNPPPWLLPLLTPLIARMVVRGLMKEHPDWGEREIAAKLREDLGRSPNAQEVRLLAEVLRRWPNRAGGEAGAAAAAEADSQIWYSPTSVVLVAANLVALYGVVALGWNVFALVLLFWIENVIVGALNVARMLCVDPLDLATWAGKLFLVPFFCLHYGLFTAVHGTLVIAFFGGQGAARLGTGLFPLEAASQAVLDYGLGVSVAAIAASHFFSFLWNYLGRGEFRRTSLTDLMMQPYSRVVVLHVVVLTGGFAVLALGSPLWALIPLLALKIWLDLRAHLKEHRAGPAPAAKPDKQ